jgi:hypothetical protein
MKSRIHKLLGASLMIVAMAGCGMTGSWSSASIEPEIARDEFAMFGVKPAGAEFTRADITIRDDGSYMADVHYGDIVHHSTGTWEKEGEKITFVDSEGISRTYDADLSGDHKELALARPIEGTDVKLVLKRKG